MFENFNPDNEEDIQELFNYLEKDKFNNLSISEQNQVIDILISISNQVNNGSKIKTIGLVRGSDGLTDIGIQKLIDTVGYEKFRDIMRKTISQGQLQLSSLTPDDLESLYDKIKQGNLSDDELVKLHAILNNTLPNNSVEDVNFSSYTILHLYSSLLAKNEKESEVKLLADAEPFMTAAYVSLLSAFLSRNDNAIGKMFSKHGFDKTKLAIDNLTAEFTNLIIDYSKEHDLAPERTMIALVNVLRILSSPVDTSMNCPDDKIGDVLEHVLLGTTELSDGEHAIEEVRKHFNAKTKESTNNSANADIKESNNNHDIRKLLLDD